MSKDKSIFLFEEEEMPGIFEHCEKWRFRTCPDPAAATPESGRGRTSFSAAEAGGKSRIERACRRCDEPLRIRRKQCPICGGRSLESSAIPMLEVDHFRVRQFVCEGCGRDLYSYEKKAAPDPAPLRREESGGGSGGISFEISG
jgi:hypothetical protein